MMTSRSTRTRETERRAGVEVVEFAECDCCGLREECTPEYINKIRERYKGKWICGLCAEAVNYEKTGVEEALNQHMHFYNHYKSSLSPPLNSALHLISAIRNLLRRSLAPSTPFTSIPALSSPPHHHHHDSSSFSSCNATHSSSD